jgi:O-antigen/teichoic acid export membrane protein
MANKSLDNALYNILTNVIKIVAVSIISFAITAILVRELGQELFGVVPLFTSMNRYIGLITVVLSASVGRFVSLSYFKGKIDDANKYYSSSFFGILFIASIAFMLFYGFSFFLDVFFQFPIEKFYEVRIFFILSVTSLLLSSILSTFNVPAFIKHAFYLTDIVNIFSKIVQIGFLLFLVGHITLIWFGFSLLSAALVSIILTYLISIRLLPDLRVKIKNISSSKLKDMGGMGLNSFFNSLGILLYTSSDIIIVNVLLGSIESGRYGIAVQCGMVVTMLGGSVTRLLAPVLVELIAKDRREELINYIVKFTKLITVFSAIPFIVFVVFSKPLLGFWLGDGFESLYLLNIFVVSNQLFHQTTSLTFTYFNMRNKLRIPAIMTFIAGLLNIVLSVILVKYTELGVYGVALGTFISILLKTIIFNVIYASRLLEMSPLLVWKAVLKGLYWPLILGGVLFILFNLTMIHSILVLILCVASVLFIYALGALYLPLSSEDRTLLFKISKLDKLKWKTKSS